ncbi:MAG TPA: hypothetical protein VFJ74_08530 [Gemmatimonadaceae bacterium]|nr:hypothetical protein [Gemmatimonadaceae bacterium]
MPNAKPHRPGPSPASPSGARALAALVVLAVAMLFGVSGVAGAQQRDSTRDTTRAGPRTRADSLLVATDTTTPRPARVRTRARRPAPTSAVPDSLLHPPISPRRAFVYSLLVPGQGQTALRRPKAAALFATIELGTIAMIAKSKNDLRIARAHRADSVFTGNYTVGTDGDSVRVYTQDPLVARIRARRLHVEDWMATLLFNHLFSGADAFVAAQLWDLPAQVSFQAAPRGFGVTASIPW